MSQPQPVPRGHERMNGPQGTPAPALQALGDIPDIAEQREALSAVLRLNPKPQKQ